MTGLFKADRRGKRLAAVILTAVMLLSLTGCAPKIPQLKDLFARYSGPMTEEQMKEEGIYGLSVKDFQRNWGEEYSFVDKRMHWTENGKYLRVVFEGDDHQDLKAVEASVSATMYATVTEFVAGTVPLITPEEDQWERRSGDKIFFSMDWLSDEQAAQIKVGTELKIEYDGLLMESYPMQIHQPYSVEIVGFHEVEAKAAEEPETEPASTEGGNNDPESGESGTGEESSQALEPATAQGGGPYIVEIRNDRASYMLPATEFILKEGIYIYFFPSICMDDLDVVLSTGETIPFKDAVDQGFDVITQLTKQGLDYGIGVSEEDEEKRESDPVDSALTEAILSCNGTGDPDVIRLEAHQPLARIRQDDGSTDWYLTYLYREYELEEDGRPRLHYENRSAMAVTITDNGAEVLTAVEDLTGGNHAQRLKEVFPEALNARVWEFDEIEPNGVYRLERKLEKLTGQAPDPKDMDEEFWSIRRSFALKLFQETAREKPDQNLLVAPLSVQLALAMAANGAKGETLRQMEDVICGGRSIHELNPWFCDYQNRLNQMIYGKLNISNSIWVRQDRAQEIKKDYLHRLAGCFDAQMNSGAFDSAMAKRINDWVRESTDGMIPEMVQDLNPDDALLLFNALTFDAKWVHPFMNYGTSKEAFTALDGTQQEAEILKSHETDSYLKGDHVRGFLKDYEGWRFAFAVLLPDKGMDLYEYIDSLTPESLEWLLHPHEGEVAVSMPKFSADSEMELNQALTNMGMPLAFEAGANFGGMVENAGDLFIDRVLHKTFIEVTETGTRAAAATEVAMEDSLPENSVTVDRPFIYMIVDMEQMVPVFMGIETTLE